MQCGHASQRRSENILDKLGTLSYITARPVHPRGALMKRRDVGRGRRLRPVERIHRAREAKANSAALAYLPPPSDPPAPHYGGAALEGWKRIGRWPDASDLAWAETSGKARVRCGDPTADKRGGPWSETVARDARCAGILN